MQNRKTKNKKTLLNEAEVEWNGTGVDSNPFAAIADPDEDESISSQTNDDITTSDDTDRITNAKDTQDSVTPDGTKEQNHNVETSVDVVPKDSPSTTENAHPVLHSLTDEEENTAAPSSTSESQDIDVDMSDSPECAVNDSSNAFKLPPMSKEAKAAAAKAKAANKIRKAELLEEYNSKPNDPTRFHISFDNPADSKQQLSNHKDQPPATNTSPSDTTHTMMPPPHPPSNTPPTTKGILRNSSQASPSSPVHPRSQPKLDKSILLKRGVLRPHVHRYDLSFIIKKPKSDDEEESLVQKALQRFLEIMIQADAQTVIPPYFELDRQDKAIPDLCKEFQVNAVESFCALRQYFSRLNHRNEETGKVYCSLILAQNKPFREVMERAMSSLRNHNLGVYPRACDHENSSDVGWLLYSARQQDDERLAHLLSTLTGELLGVKWKQVRTTEGYKKRDPNDNSPRVMALHIEGPADKSHEIRQKLSKWYSSSSKSFPDGTKMRLIPPFNTILSRDNKVKFATLVARQEALNRRLAQTTTWEFATNLLLDKPSPTTGMSIRQVLMNIPSTEYEGASVFHTIDRSWRDENGVTFTFVPENDSDGRMYVAGLIPYLRSIDPWFLTMFTEDARNMHRLSHWDEQSKQIFSSDELGMGDNVYEDDDLNCSDEPTAIRPEVGSTRPIEVVIPEVEITGIKPTMFNDKDSVSTFRSKYKETANNPVQAPKRSKVKPSVQFSPHASTTASSALQIPADVNKNTNDDGSVSKMSDTASRLSAFEAHFATVTDDFSEALNDFKRQAALQSKVQAEQKEMLNSIMQLLKSTTMAAPANTQSSSNTRSEEAEGMQTHASFDTANHPNQMNESGGPEGAAGHG